MLQRLNATIVGGIAGTGGGPGALLALRVPGTTHAAMVQTLAMLRAAPEVSTATADIIMSEQGISKSSSADVAWNWTSGAYAGDPNLRTWGLAAIRAPQMWNLNPHAKAEGRTTATAVLDAGYDPANENLKNVITIVGRQRADDHGNHVASIIGAEHGNGVGIDGANPFAKLFLAAIPTIDGDSIATVGSGTSGSIEMLRARPEVRVVNVSLGYAWSDGSLPSVNPKARAEAKADGTFWGLALDVIGATQSLPVIVSAACNNRGEQAVFTSPLNNLGLRRDSSHASIIVVEADSAVDGNGGATQALARFSDVGGHISAPGLRVPGARIGASRT